MKARYSAILLAVVLTCCTSTRLGSLTLVSTKNLGHTYTPLQQNVTGQDCAYNILGIPIGSMNPNLQEAIDNAASATPGADMMTDMTIHRDILVTLAYNRVCVRVDGNAVNSASAVTTQPTAAAQIKSGQTSGSAYLDAVQRKYDHD